MISVDIHRLNQTSISIDNSDKYKLISTHDIDAKWIQEVFMKLIDTKIKCIVLTYDTACELVHV